MNIDDKPKLPLGKSNSQELAKQLNDEIESIPSINLNPSVGVSKNLDTSCLITHNDLPSRISSSISQHEATKVNKIPLKEKLSPDNITVVRSDRLTDGYCRSPVVHNGKFGNTPEISQTSQQVSKSITVAEPYQKITQALREWSTTETKRFLSSKHLNIFHLS